MAAYSIRNSAESFAIVNAAGATIGRYYQTERQAKHRLRDLCRADQAVAGEFAYQGSAEEQPN